MSDTLRSQLLDKVSDKVLLTKPIKDVVTYPTYNRSFHEENALVMFMVWVSKDSEHLADCLNKLDPTCFYALTNEAIGAVVNKQYALYDKFVAVIEAFDLMKVIAEVCPTHWTENFNFDYYLGLVVRHSYWWERNEPTIKTSSAKNKKALHAVRKVQES